MASAILTGAAIIALFGAASPHITRAAVASEPPGAAPTNPQFPVAPGMAGGHIVAVDDDGNSVNDQGQTSGDIFTQNAQDQSTA